MPKHLQRDLDQIKRQLLAMGTMVEEATAKAVTALVDRRRDLAAEVMAGDDRIDDMEVQIEEDCLKALALHQPVATNLRFLITVLKVNNDLERMGDIASHIAERADYLAAHPPIAVPVDLREMADRARGMVRQSLDALVRLDTSLAREVCLGDDAVDETHRRMFGLLEDLMRRDPDTIERAIHTLSASRHLERIADLATNIAEDVVFLVEAVIIRHRYSHYRSGRSPAAGTP